MEAENWNQGLAPYLSRLNGLMSLYICKISSEPEQEWSLSTDSIIPFANAVYHIIILKNFSDSTLLNKTCMSTI